MDGCEPRDGPAWSAHRQRSERDPDVALGPPAKALLAGAAVVGLCGIAVVPLVRLGPLSAHMVHHIGLMSVLAPLCAVVVAPFVRDRIQRGQEALLWTAACVQIALLWAWHAPPLHAATASGAAYAAMLVSLLAASLCFWGGILLLGKPSRWQGIVALLATGKLACLLGALLIFAPRPLYPHAAGHVAAHGLQDQQLAGLLMIVACPLSYVLVGVVLSAQLVYGLGRMPPMAGPNIAAGRLAR